MINYSEDTTSVMPSHSVRFDELEVVLPEHLTQPDLKAVASKLQGQILADYHGVGHYKTVTEDKDSNGITDAQKDSIEQDNINHSNINQNNNEQSSIEKNNHAIGDARAILQHLSTTAIANASVLVAITNESKPKLLLTRRAGHLNSHAGEVSFAGGKHETADGNNVVTALREACEETALPPSRVKIVGQLPVQTSKSGMSVRPIVALVDPDVIYVPELGEIERMFWADFSTLITQPTTEYEILYEQGDSVTSIMTPCWIIDNETVWGLTGRIIASLLQTVFNRDIPWYYRSGDC